MKRIAKIKLLLTLILVSCGTVSLPNSNWISHQSIDDSSSENSITSEHSSRTPTSETSEISLDVYDESLLSNPFFSSDDISAVSARILETKHELNSISNTLYLMAVESGYQGTYEDWQSNIRGEQHPYIQLQLEVDMLQWSFANEPVWKNLISIGKLQKLTGSTVLSINPYVGTNGHWWIGSFDTNVVATSVSRPTYEEIAPSPIIGENGNWWVGDQDTGIPGNGSNLLENITISEIRWVQSSQGFHTFHIIFSDGRIFPVQVEDNTYQTYTNFPMIGTNGNWWIGGVDTGVRALGENGLSAFDVFLLTQPDFEGDEEDWIHWLISGGQDIVYHTIQFDSMGGDFIPPQLVKDGSKINKPNNPTKLGHDFLGWYIDEEPWVFFGFAVTESLILTAKWSPTVYTIQYELNGGINALGNPSHYVYGNPIQLLSPTRTGYTFLGWYLDSNFENLLDQNILYAQALTIYAGWRANEYTITYYLDGGLNDESNPLTYTYGSSLTLLPPTREEYDFVGWYLNSSMTIPFNGITETTIGNIILYAKWRSLNDVPVESITLRYDVIGLSSVTATYQLEATVLPEEATNKTLLWTSSNTSIATVNSTGLVSAKARGSTTITATSNNGINVTARVTIYYALDSYVVNELEPNGSTSLADPILVNGTTFKGYNSSKSDADYFALIMSSNQYYQINFYPSYSVDTDYFLVGLLDSSGTVLAAALKLNSNTRYLSFWTTYSGTYYVVVLYSSSSPYSSGMGYRGYSRWC